MTGVQQPTAIVGMAAILPGAGDLATYWRNLSEGRDAITEVPSARWGGPHYDPAQAHRPDRLYCNRGGVVDEFATFQPLKYGIMPNSVDDIEPDQLLMLDVATAAIQDAGGHDRMPSGDRIGVIVGRGGTLSPGQARHAQRVRLPTQMIQVLRELIPTLTDEQIGAVRQRFDDVLGPCQPEGLIGLVPNLAASRVANRLNLRGPAYTVDAACASSLLAVDQGIAELGAGKLDVVLAGGVHHVHDISFWSVFSQMGALSRQGRIRPFDANADGLLIGEGTGMVVLKRLADAERDGDRIYAVIRGTGVSSDGRSASMFNPATSGQVLAIRRAWEAAGLDPTAPDAVGLIEAHGTATPTGDAAELTTLATVFGPHRGGERAVIGSVKSMIGHAMPAAGIAGLIKAALAVHHGVLPPTLHVENPRAEMAATRFAPIGQARPWEGKRRAGVNAFGFGGINAHVILEEWKPSVRRVVVTEPQRFLRLAAADPASLMAALDAGKEGGEGPCRVAIANPTEERRALARKMIERGEPWRGGRDIWFTPTPLLGPGGGKLMFVFPGVEAEFAPRTADVAARFGLPDREWSNADLGRHGTGLVEVGALLSTALRKIKILPDAYAGHSLGEWTAARVSGLMSARGVDEFLHSFDAQSVEVSGYAFAAVGAGADQVVPLLADYPGVVLSHDNAPGQAVVNGPHEQIDRLVEDLRDRKIMCQALPFRSAFHTPAFESGLRSIGAALGRFEITRPDAPVWSATLAAPFPDEDPVKVGETFIRHMVTTVRFRETTAAMHDAGFRVFLQVGAGQLASMISDNLTGKDHLAMPVNVARRSGLDQLGRVAAALWVEGASPDFSLLDPAPAAVIPEGTKVVGPNAKAGPSMRLDLGGPQLSMGAGAEQVLGISAAAPARPAAPAAPARPVAPGAPARPVTPVTRPTAPTRPAAPPRPAPQPRPVPQPAQANPNDPAKMLGALQKLAGHSNAAAELAALLQETADNAATMLSTPRTAPRPNGNGNGNGTRKSPPPPRQAPPPPRQAPPPPRQIPAQRPPTPAPAGQERKSVLHVSMETMPYLNDHCFYAQPPDWPTVEDRWPVVPATTVAQHMLDAAAAAVPGMHPVTIREARFNRWLIAAPSQDVPITVKPAGPNEVAVIFGQYARSTVELAPAWPAPPTEIWRHDPATERPPTISAERMYEERLMFHGPLFQAVTKVHAYGDRHVRGQVTAPAVPGALLDNALQLIGNWIITTQPNRTVALPVRLGKVSFYGPHPTPGKVLEVVARIRQVDFEQIVGDAQLVDDGKVWAVIEGVVDRRFDSHPTARVAERFPQRHGMSTLQPEGWTLAYEYWTDLVTRGMAAHGILGAAGGKEYESKPPATRKQWLLGRIAAKDAVRFRQWEAGHTDVYPIELTVTNEASGRPRVAVREKKGLIECDISLSHCADLGVAIARPWEPGDDRSGPGVGIDATEVKPAEESTIRFACGPGERELLDRLAANGGRDLWFTRFWAAKEAVAKAEGTGFQGRPQDFAVIGSEDDGSLTVQIRDRTYTAAFREIGNPPDLPPRRYTVAWTWGPRP
ncbi:beta-ketoacyl synthase N-terminal-like domain-containing protein [Actinoplanes sp. NPDC051851]|uniref:beta-ketoacyl synthase N-terminal-like domain-containing protein n=1 Tax=Actinoplanes sp. NPDC051851 TaxID=3154753 RepID=UPI003415B7DF